EVLRSIVGCRRRNWCCAATFLFLLPLQETDMVVERLLDRSHDVIELLDVPRRRNRELGPFAQQIVQSLAPTVIERTDTSRLGDPLHPEAAFEIRRVGEDTIEILHAAPATLAARVPAGDAAEIDFLGEALVDHVLFDVVTVSPGDLLTGCRGR